MILSKDELLEMSQYSFIRMDGAWFLALAKKFGIQTAWEMDVEAWKQFSYLFGKRIRKKFIPEPVWPDSLIDAIEIFGSVLKIKGRDVIIDSDSITVRVTDCETQKAIAKAGIADCGIVTVETYQGIIRGLFNTDMNIDVTHTQNLNHGDPCCEVVIRKIYS